MPKDIDIGVRAIRSGVLILREHNVRPVSSSNVALGNRASQKVREVESCSSKRHTIVQSGDHRQQSGIKCVSIVIDTSRIDIEYPYSFAWMYAK